jgi:superfamily II DNA/RNA helicase
MAGLLIKELKIRSLIQRILIVTPANLCFQWQRELRDKFREDFELVRGERLRSSYGSNPWQDIDQVITSISWVSRIEDANESLMRSHWDLIIVDEAHKMSAYSEDKKTLAYQLGESLSDMTDHYLLMTATPHKGDPKNFSLFLRLLDKDVYGDIKSLEKAMEEKEAPFYLRRVKEALVTFPDPDTGVAKSLFTKRNVKTVPFPIDDEELDFYDLLTRYVENQSIKAAQSETTQGRALGFTMAMLQRRFASSVYAVRRTLERMKDKREKILKDPEAHKAEQVRKKLPDDFEDLPEEMQEEIITELEDAIISIDPQDLREEIAVLGKLVATAKTLEAREVESKIIKLRKVITESGIFSDPKMKLLIFTEHKDTLDYLAGDGRDGRPLGKLREWGLVTTQIHGGMKIGDRDTPGSRIYAEREFKEDCQVMVATEAAGEGINLQFCWYMINYDIPWNPVRLEQRMGRIHRYGQEKDCLILNFVSTNTREGRVMERLFQRITQIEEDIDPNHTGKVFNVMGDIFPANELEKMLREMYARNLTEDVIKDRIVEQVDVEKLRQITESTLEGLAKRELNLSAIVGKSEEAKERRLVPEVVEDFFLKACPIAGISTKEIIKDNHVYRLGRLPRTLLPYASKIEPRFGKLGREYKQVVFDKQLLVKDPTLEWVTPGHPLYESVRWLALDQVQSDLERGSVFFDLRRKIPALLQLYSGEIRDGIGNILHKRLFVVEISLDGSILVRQPTAFLDFSPAPEGTNIPEFPQCPSRNEIETILYQQALLPMLEEERRHREKDVRTISEHMEISLNAIIDKAQIQFAELHRQKDDGSLEQGLDGRLKMLEDKLDELNHRLERRRLELAKERDCAIDNIHHLGSAWVLLHPERETLIGRNMITDPEIERAAITAAIKYEEARGCAVQSVEEEDRGFDLISRHVHTENPLTAVEVRFIEVKGRANVGEVALSNNEYKTAQRLKKDYWLYTVFNCGSNPEIHTIQDPTRLGWEPIVKVDHYYLNANIIKSESF